MFDSRPLTPAFGAEIIGLDLTKPFTDAIRSALLDVWIDRGMLLFRGQKIEPAHQVALASIFGDPEIHPAREAHHSAHPEMTVIRYDPEKRAETSVYIVDGVELANWLPWHNDLIYMEKIARGGCLLARQVTSTGGLTGFVDRIHLYTTLSAPLRQAIAEKRVVYRIEPCADKHKFYRRNARMINKPKHIVSIENRIESDFPRVSHPMVFQQPETGRPVLNVSPMFAEGIVGSDDSQGDALLQSVIDHIIDSPDKYFHRWQVDDIVLWDNWRMLHSAEGTPVDQARRMDRVSMSGDYGLGRLA